MTRTERNQYPAAVLKDRHSRSGLTKTELSHKGGDGAHNWGSVRRIIKGDDELGGQADASAETNGDGMFNLDVDEGVDRVSDLKHNINININTEGSKDVEGNIAISTSPSESMSSLDSHSRTGESPTRPTAGGRRLSNVSDEERERARVYREHALNKGGIDLAHIARTSYGIAQSPPTTSHIATSPTKTNGGFNFKQ